MTDGARDLSFTNLATTLGSRASGLRVKRAAWAQAHALLEWEIPRLREASFRRAEALSALAAAAQREGAEALGTIEATAAIAARVDPKVAELASLVRERRFMRGVARARGALQRAAEAEATLSNGGVVVVVDKRELESAVDALCALLTERVELESVVGPEVAAQLELCTVLETRASELRRAVRTSSCAQLDDALSSMGWPLRGETCKEEEEEEAAPARAEAFRAAFALALRLQRRVVVAAERPSQPPNAMSVECCWAVETLCGAIVARLRFHYCGDKATNRADKPEWLLNEIVEQVRLHLAFFEDVVQPLLDEELGGGGGKDDVDVVDAVAALLRALVDVACLHFDAHWAAYTVVVRPHSAVRPLLAHAADAAVIFRRTLRNEFEYAPSAAALAAGAFPLGAFCRTPDRLSQWAENDAAFARERLRVVLATADAWTSGERDDGDAAAAAAAAGGRTCAAVAASSIAPPLAAAGLLGLLNALSTRWTALPSLDDQVTYVRIAVRPILATFCDDELGEWLRSALGAVGPPRQSHGRGSSGGGGGGGGAGGTGRRQHGITNGGEGGGRNGKKSAGGSTMMETGTTTGKGLARFGSALTRAAKRVATSVAVHARGEWKWSAASARANGARWLAAALREWEFRSEAIALAEHIAHAEAACAAAAPAPTAAAVAVAVVAADMVDNGDGDAEAKATSEIDEVEEEDFEVEVEASEMLLGTLGAIAFAGKAAMSGAVSFMSSRSNARDGGGDGAQQAAPPQFEYESDGDEVAFMWSEACAALNSVAATVVDALVERIQAELRSDLRAYRISLSNGDCADSENADEEVREAARDGEPHPAWSAALTHVADTLRCLSRTLAAGDFRLVCLTTDAFLDAWFAEHAVRSYSGGEQQTQLLRAGLDALLALASEPLADDLELRRSVGKASDARAILEMAPVDRNSLRTVLADLCPAQAQRSDADEAGAEVRAMADVLASGYRIEHLAPRDALRLVERLESG